MITKYGEIHDIALNNYLERLINKVFKLLPLKEEDNPTLDIYLESLQYELIGGKNVLLKLSHNPEYLSLILSLESLNYIDDLELYKRKIFECIGIIKKLNSH